MSDSQPNVMIQQPLPLAFVNGEAVIEKPEDLYIPPDALEVILETFSGPLDLLLYLIRKQKLDIVELPILKITEQYMDYVAMMQDIKLELAAEYLLMAALLAEIKSRLLLPKPPVVDEDEVDPRAELIRRLKEYEIIKQAAQELDGLPRYERDFFPAKAQPAASITPEVVLPSTTLSELVLAFHNALQRAATFEHHQISREQLSTRERMSYILQNLNNENFVSLAALFTPEEGRAGCVVSFLAILELVKEGLLECIQAEPYADVHVRLGQGQAAYEN